MADGAQATQQQGTSKQVVTAKKEPAKPATPKRDELPQKIKAGNKEVRFATYENESQMPALMALFQKELSEPYSIYTYRYFINNWPTLCVLALVGDQIVGAIVCKLDNHRGRYRGYIAMLAVENEYRHYGIGSLLAKKAINAMKEQECEEVVLETEVTNKGSLGLYEKLGFIKDKRLCRYYLNGVDAFRLKIFLPRAEDVAPVPPANE